MLVEFIIDRSYPGQSTTKLVTFKDILPIQLYRDRDRAYRIGQTKNVMVYRLLTTGTMEERINNMIRSKAAHWHIVSLTHCAYLCEI